MTRLRGRATGQTWLDTNPVASGSPHERVERVVADTARAAEDGCSRLGRPSTDGDDDREPPGSPTASRFLPPDGDLYSTHDGANPAMASSDSSTSDDQYEISRRWDDPTSYGEFRSHFGEGNYPPDWEARRQVVMERQQFWCGRCGRYSGDVDRFEVHHLVPLSQGGPNDLDNLVGLCGDCHALMHPGNDEVEGNPDDAPLLPDPDCDDRVAVVRMPATEHEFRTVGQHVEALTTTDWCDTGANDDALSEACYALDARTAKRVAADLEGTLAAHGLALDDDECGVHLRVLDRDGSAATGATATIETTQHTETKTVDDRGHVNFTVPGSTRTVDVHLDGGSGTTTVSKSLGRSGVRRAVEHVQLDGPTGPEGYGGSLSRIAVTMVVTVGVL